MTQAKTQAALWVDAEGTGTEITVEVEIVDHADGGRDMEVSLPFGALGGRLILHLDPSRFTGEVGS